MTQSIPQTAPHVDDRPRSPAEIYEDWFVPALFRPLTERVVDGIQPVPGTRVLDVACGTGIVARRLASTMGSAAKVTGLDLSPAMIATASAASQREALDIEWHLGRLESLPFADRSFDLVTCQQGLQFSADREKAARELWRVLSDRGSIVVSVWQELDKHPVYEALHAAMLRAMNTPAMATPFSLGDAGELQRLLTTAGFVDVVVTPLTINASFTEPRRYVELQIEAVSAGIVQLQQMDAADRARLVAGVGDELDELIRELTVDDRLQFPMHAYVARARREASHATDV